MKIFRFHFENLIVQSKILEQISNNYQIPGKENPKCPYQKKKK